MKTIALWIAASASVAVQAAVPQLKYSAEPIPAAGIKAKLLAKSEKKIQVSPKKQRWQRRMVRSTGEVEKEWVEEHYDVREIWREHELAGEWRDQKGNSLTIASVSALCPEFDEDHAMREEIDAKIAKGAESFEAPDDAALAKWAAQFTGKPVAASALSPFAAGSSNVADARLVDFGSASRIAAFFKAKDRMWRWADISLAQTPRPREGETLMKTFLKSVISDARPKSASTSSGVKELKLKGYEFESDMKDQQVSQFIKKANLFLIAMRDAYMRYVPPQNEISKSKVRLFSTRQKYDEYLKNMDAGEFEGRSVGLWSPGHEELVILYDRRGHEKDKEVLRKTLKTMRHEAFHQYLYYATGSGKHAMWFNEGHACFFENAKYDSSKNYVKINDDPEDRRPAAVAKDPEKYARRVKDILEYGREKFYSGSLREVNDNYTAAWALIYFLQKGAPVNGDFAAYRQVLPTYLKEMAAGKAWREATKAAWSHVEDRDFVADFLKFWKRRNLARSYEPPAAHQR